MEIKSFQDLLLWQKGHQFVLEIYKLTREFPGEERFGLISQIRRSSVSICANIAEGGKKSRNDFIRFLVIADGSLEETKYHLILSKDLEYLNLEKFKVLSMQADEIGRILNALIRSLRSKQSYYNS